MYKEKSMLGISLVVPGCSKVWMGGERGYVRLIFYSFDHYAQLMLVTTLE